MKTAQAWPMPEQFSGGNAPYMGQDKKKDRFPKNAAYFLENDPFFYPAGAKRTRFQHAAEP